MIKNLGKRVVTSVPLSLDIGTLTCQVGIARLQGYRGKGCGYTKPDLSDLVTFHSGQVEIFHLLVIGQVQNMYNVNKIMYYIF